MQISYQPNKDEVHIRIENEFLSAQIIIA